MPKIVEAKSPAAVNKLRNEEGLHGVGGVRGLMLQVSRNPKSGVLRRSWILRTTVGAKRRDIGLGAFPDVTLERARAKAREAKTLIEAGIDPVEERRRIQEELRKRQTRMTFRQAAEKVLAIKGPELRHRKSKTGWAGTLEAYVYPHFGDRPVEDIDVDDVVAMLEPIWADMPPTAKKILQRTRAVFDWSIAAGHRKASNPATWRGRLDALLPAPGKIHRATSQPSLPYQRMAELMADLRTREGTTARALEFSILTATRSTAVRGATWSEIDFDDATWTLPADRAGTKITGDEAGDVVIALSDDALALLSELPQGNPDALIFLRDGKPLSENAFGNLIGRMHDASIKAGGEGYTDPRAGGRRIVQHGFRATFRTWGAERTAYPEHVLEMALGHRVSSEVIRAYRRTTLLERRRKLMAEWASYVTEPADQDAKIVNLRKN
ncbi:MAG: integrase family protein [Acetobacterales bacterium]